MTGFDKYPRIFRLVLGFIVAYLVGLATLSFYRFASTTTNENWFKTSPSNLYIAASISGNCIGADLFQDSTSIKIDSVMVGDLLLAINDRSVTGCMEADSILSRIPADSILALKIFRPGQNRFFIYQVTRRAVTENWLRDVSTTAYVRGVLPGGASERAGMKRGDLLYRIDGKNFSSSREAELILQEIPAGKVIAYDIIRNNHSITLQVPMTRLGLHVTELLFFLCGFLYLGFGTFLAMQRPRIISARLLGLAFILIGFFFAAIMNQHSIEFDSLSRLRFVSIMTGLFVGLAIWCHSRFYFPKEQTELNRRRWLRYSPYGLAITLLIIYFLSIFTNIFPIFIYNFYIADFILVGGIIVMLLYINFVHLLSWQHRPDEYKKLSHLLSLTEFGAFVTGIYLLSSLTFSDIKGYYCLIAIPFFLVPLVYLYAINQYRLLDLTLRLSRSIQYAIVSNIWLVVLVLVSLIGLFYLAKIDLNLPAVRIAGSAIELVDSVKQLERSTVQEKFIIIMVALGLIFLIWKFGRSGKRVIDKKFHRAPYDYRRAAGELADVLATKLKLEDLARGMTQKLAEILQVKRVGVFFYRDEKSCCCHQEFGFDPAGWDKLSHVINENFLKILHQHRSDSRFSIDYLPYEIKENFLLNGIQFIIPIRSRDRLVGSLMIGQKLSESIFLEEDLIFLSNVPKQASIAIENAFLYVDLREQERLKYELEIARRIQLASLPQTTPEINGLDIAGISIPALEVGGDYYDYLNGNGIELTVIVGDVSGKGTSAALYMSKMQGILRSLHDFGLSPRELFMRANQLLYRDLEKKSFVTAIGATFDTKSQRLVLARAGHLPLFQYRSETRSVEEISPKGVGLGLDKASVFDAILEEVVIQFDSGDVFLFVTDGVTEAHGHNGDLFGEENLQILLKENSALTATQIRDRIVDKVNQFVADAHQHDDLTVVVVKIV